MDDKNYLDDLLNFKGKGSNDRGSKVPSFIHRQIIKEFEKMDEENREKAKKEKAKREKADTEKIPRIRVGRDRKKAGLPELITGDESKAYRRASIMERVIKLTEDVALRNLGKAGILSSREFTLLFQSIVTPREKEVYNRYRNAEEYVRITIGALREIRNDYRTEIAHISGYCRLWNEYDTFMSIINRLLSMVEDDKVKNNMLHYLFHSKELLYTNMQVTNNRVNNQVNRLTDNSRGFNLLAILKEHKTTATLLMKKIKTIQTFILKRMSDDRVIIKPYVEKINEIVQTVRELKPAAVNSLNIDEIERVILTMPDYDEIEIDRGLFYELFKNITIE